MFALNFLRKWPQEPKQLRSEFSSSWKARRTFYDMKDIKTILNFFITIIPLFWVSVSKVRYYSQFPVHTVIVRCWMKFLISFFLSLRRKVYTKCCLMYIEKRDEEKRNHKSTFILAFYVRRRHWQYNQSGEKEKRQKLY
jgi:hypothetical protein